MEIISNRVESSPSSRYSVPTDIYIYSFLLLLPPPVSIYPITQTEFVPDDFPTLKQYNICQLNKYKKTCDE